MDSSEASSGTPAKVSAQACLQCRVVKMKCNMQTGASKCERCLRKSMDCTFQKHRRGRKPGTRLQRTLKPFSETQLSPSASVPNESLTSESVSSKGDQGHGSTSEGHLSPHKVPYVGSNTDLPRANSNAEEIVRPVWEDSESLQPSGLLNKDAMSGKFSLKHILSSSTEQPHSEKSGDYLGAQLPIDDPLRLEGLNLPIAKSLFDNFMRYLNPYISQFDPKLHTFEYVQLRSSFLLSAVLTAAAKAFHPPLHPRVLTHTERLFAKSFSQGVKTVETVQAILVMTYWKEADDTRSWLSVGYAIRMCIELGWHKLESLYSQNNTGQTELQRREARNIERTWLIIFVYDRSVSLQIGKPWMIDDTDFICSARDWYKDEYAVFGGDALLCSFVRLRLIGCEAIELLSPTQQSAHLYQQRHSETLIRLLMSEIKRWEIEWLPVADSDSVEPCQAFLMKFYSIHLRLLLNSFPLQQLLKKSQPSAPISKRVVWTCFHAAVEMLRLLAEDIGPSQLLYLAQDSVLVMTAYAAVFLIKLLSSVPYELLSDLEGPALQAISSAAQAFGVQRAAPRSGCALQAKFLSNVVKLYQTTKRPATSGAAPRLAALEQQAPAGSLSRSATVPVMQEANAPISTSHEYATSRSTTQAHEADGALHSQAQGNNTGTIQEGRDSHSTMDTWDLTFTDPELWDNMFITAGFDVNTGVFQTNNMNEVMD